MIKLRHLVSNTYKIKLKLKSSFRLDGQPDKFSVYILINNWVDKNQNG